MSDAGKTLPPQQLIGNRPTLTPSACRLAGIAQLQGLERDAHRGLLELVTRRFGAVCGRARRLTDVRMSCCGVIP